MDPVSVKAVLTSLLEVLRAKLAVPTLVWEKIAVDLAINGIEYEINNTNLVDDILKLLRLKGIKVEETPHV
jgi:hypothetical protein